MHRQKRKKVADARNADRSAGGRDMFEQRKIFATDGEYFLYPIAEQDRKDYVELQRQQNGENSLFFVI